MPKTYDEAWTKGYRDAAKGVREEPLGEWDSQQRYLKGQQFKGVCEWCKT